MKTLLSALAVVMLLGAATAAPASAECWRGPYGGIHCTHPYWHHHWGYGGYGGGYGYWNRGW